MRRFGLRKIRNALHLATLWLLVLALPVYGSSGTLLQILGPAHRHVQSATGASLLAAPGLVATTDAHGFAWVDGLWTSWQNFVHAQAHVGGHFSHPHSHDDFERHHHDVGDSSVVALAADGIASAIAAELGAAAASGSATLPFALAQSLRLPRPASTQARWLLAPSAVWRSADPRRLDRPPQAAAHAISPFGALRPHSVR